MRYGSQKYKPNANHVTNCYIVLRQRGNLPIFPYKV